jgi:hypothetical protein
MNNYIIPPYPIFIITSELARGTTGYSISAAETSYTGGISDQVRFVFFETTHDKDKYPKFPRKKIVEKTTA